MMGGREPPGAPDAPAVRLEGEIGPGCETGVQVAAHEYPGPRLLPQSGRLPMGMPSAHTGSGVYQADRGGQVWRRVHDELEGQRLPGESPSHLLPPLPVGPPPPPGRIGEPGTL